MRHKGRGCLPIVKMHTLLANQFPSVVPGSQHWNVTKSSKQQENETCSSVSGGKVQTKFSDSEMNHRAGGTCADFRAEDDKSWVLSLNSTLILIEEVAMQSTVFCSLNTWFNSITNLLN